MVSNRPVDTYGSPIETEFFDPSELTTNEKQQLREFLIDIDTQLRSILAQPFNVSHSVNPQPNIPYLLVTVQHPIGTSLHVNLTPESNNADVFDELVDASSYENVVDETVKMVAAATIQQTREIIGDDDVAMVGE